MIAIWNSTENLPWWVGKQMTCPHCGRVVQLEVGDEHHRSCISANHDFFEIACAQCTKTVTLVNDKK